MMRANQLAEALGAAWGRNDAEEFAALFHEDGQIVHPYFKHSVMPSVAMEVMNAAVKGSTVLRHVELRRGSGDGTDDALFLVFEETGNEIGRELGHVGDIQMLAELRDGRFSRLEVLGFEVKRNEQVAGGTRYVRRDVGRPTSREIAEMLGRCWSDNDMDTFVSLFSEDARIQHAVLEEEAPPEVIADVMNSNVKGTTRLRSFALLKGDGQGLDDVLELQFDETGNEIGYQPSVQGSMSVTATIKDNRIARLQVHGYQVVDQSASPAGPVNA